MTGIITDNLGRSSGLVKAVTAGGGITNFDTWRLTAALSTSADPLSANLERVDNATFEKIGTGMTESSGIFAFPATGLWQIKFTGCGHGYNSQLSIKIDHTTDDGSTWDTAAYNGAGDGDGWYTPVVSRSVFNVTDLANDKVKFNYISGASSSLWGHTDMTETHMEFIRIGDNP